MDRIDVIFKSVLAATGAIFGYLFGGWSVLLQILLAFVIIDYLTGLLASGVEGKLSSKVGFKGIAKKVMIFVIVSVAHLVDQALVGSGIYEGQMIRDAVIFFYLGNELLSIIENAGRTGLPIPEVIQNAVAVLKGKGDDK